MRRRGLTSILLTSLEVSAELGLPALSRALSPRAAFSRAFGARSRGAFSRAAFSLGAFGCAAAAADRTTLGWGGGFLGMGGGGEVSSSGGMAVLYIAASSSCIAFDGAGRGRSGSVTLRVSVSRRFSPVHGADYMHAS